MWFENGRLVVLPEFLFLLLSSQQMIAEEKRRRHALQKRTKTLGEAMESLKVGTGSRCGAATLPLILMALSVVSLTLAPPVPRFCLWQCCFRSLLQQAVDQCWSLTGFACLGHPYRKAPVRHHSIPRSPRNIFSHPCWSRVGRRVGGGRGGRSVCWL